MDQSEAQNQSDNQQDQDRPLRACVECRKKRARVSLPLWPSCRSPSIAHACDIIIAVVILS
jgi:hypothetical protein